LLGFGKVAIVKYMNNLIIQGIAMSLLGGNDLKEQQKINELELKINREKQKLDKKLTRQKILLGAFLVDALEKDSVEGLKKYTADNLLDFLSRQTDKDLMADLVKGLGGKVDTGNNDENKIKEG
jgi:hypothetical protein